MYFKNYLSNLIGSEMKACAKVTNEDANTKTGKSKRQPMAIVLSTMNIAANTKVDAGRRVIRFFTVAIVVSRQKTPDVQKRASFEGNG